MRYRHIIFDLDGTLVDSLPDIAVAANLALSAIGLPQVAVDQVSQYIGRGARQLMIDLLLDQWPQTTVNSRIDAAMEQFYQHYSANIAEHSVLFDGVKQGIERLKQQGHQLTLCTNKPAHFTAMLLERLAMRQWFNEVVSADQLPNHKPHPQPLLYLCEKLGVNAQDSLMVGDSMNDVLAAEAAHIDCVCMRYGYNHGVAIESQFAGPVFNHFDELLIWIEQAKAS